MDATTEPARRLRIGTQRLVLIGTPPRLSGMLQLANAGGEKIKLKSAVVRPTDGDWGDPHVDLRLEVSARLEAGAALAVPVSLTVDARMPPGERRGEADFGDGERREVVLKVLEHREVAVTPSSFELHGAAGGKLALPAVITNLGNVPFAVPKVALVALGEDDAVSQLFHVAMARKGAEGHQAALDAYAQLVGASEVEPAKLVVGDGAGASLPPGEQLETTFTFELPGRLARHRTYHGSFAIGKARCSVEIDVADAPTNGGPPRKRSAS